MKYFKRYGLTLLILFVLYYVFNFLSLITFENPDQPLGISDTFETLKIKIQYLQNVVDAKQGDINNLREAFAANVKYYNNLVEKQKIILENLKNNSVNFYGTLTPLLLNSSNKTHSKLVDDQMKSLLMKLKLNTFANLSTALTNAANLDIEFPQVIEFLPHLVGQTHLVQPKFKQTKGRFASIVIGVPTIKREKTSYLLETLKSLFDAMNDLEKLEALVVVMIAEIEDLSFVQHTIKIINQAFKYEIDSGLLDIIVPPLEYYPNLNSMGPDKVFNDSMDRVKWRTKQNYDFSYLMTYGQKRGVYYLQLEDDVVSKSGFFTIIKDFINKQKSIQNTDEWMMIEFSQLGFIGKLFKCHDLPMFVNFFLMFASDKPVDWLYESVFSVKICNPEKGEIHCERSKTDLKLRYKPSLFQHVGVQSSLKGKTQKLRDKDFGKQILIVAHDNPPAKMSTSLKTYMKHTIESVYLGQNFFWCMAPAANDFILFEFEKPTPIRKYYIKSGNPEHPDDKLYNATFHIKTVKPIPDKKLPLNYLQTTDNFYIIDKFSNELGTVNGIINQNITGEISQIRIHLPTASETWIIISEIDFSTKEPDEKSLSMLTAKLTESIFTKI